MASAEREQEQALLARAELQAERELSAQSVGALQSELEATRQRLASAEERERAAVGRLEQMAGEAAAARDAAADEQVIAQIAPRATLLPSFGPMAPMAPMAPVGAIGNNHITPFLEQMQNRLVG